MRIPLCFTLLFVSFCSFAQEVIEFEEKKESKVQPYRSYMLPASSAHEAQRVGQEAMRYAIPVEGWSQHNAPGQATFSSSFAAPFSWIGREAIISIESASTPYTVKVDGHQVGTNLNAALPAQFNITDFLDNQTEASITVTMFRDSASSQLEGWGSDKSFVLGPVVMLSQPTMFIRDVEVQTSRLSGVLNATIAVIVKSEALNPRSSRINYELLTPEGEYVTRGGVDVSLSMRQEDTIRISAAVPDQKAWSAENPNLYTLNLSTQYRGRTQENFSFGMGLRSIDMGKDGELSINGVAQTLKAMEVKSSIELDDLSEIKAKGYNTIKVAAGEHNREIYSYADSIGLYVIATAPINSSKSGEDIKRGGNPSNDPARLSEYIARVDAIYNLVKIHPSVIAFSLADNSLNGFNLYESYLYLKGREGQRPIIYLNGGGEWNNDQLKVEF